jgi:sugar phosphate permease
VIEERQSARPAAAGTARIGTYRYLVTAVVWGAFFFNSFDRSAVALLLVDQPFLRDMNLQGSPEKQGLLMTFLLLPYALSNIFLGYTADRWGPRKVLTVMAGLWAATALWTSAIGSYPLMLVGRVVRGLADGPLFPVANRYVRYWFPPWERGGANALWSSGNRVGMTLSVPLLALAIDLWGWRVSFVLQAASILLLVVPTVWLLTADAPEAMTRIGAAEREYIVEGRGAGAALQPGERGNLSRLLRDYRFWLMVTHHFAVLATSAGLVTWLPKYLREARGFDVGGMVLFTSLPYLGSMLSSLAMGFLSDRIGRRAATCAVSLAGAALSIGLAATVADPFASALCMVLGMILWGMSPPVHYAIMQRIVPAPIIATGIGIDNGLANFGSAVAPAVIGVLIAATGSYVAGLLFLTALGLIGAGGAVILAFQGY